MDKESILNKLDKLVELIEETDTDIVDSHLFNDQYINALAMKSKVRDWHTGRSIFDPDTDSELIIEIMQDANKIWKTRKRWQQRGISGSAEEMIMKDEIEDAITRGAKIDAIKIYRAKMNDLFDEQVSLRDSKDYIDQMAKDMKRKGIIT